MKRCRIIHKEFEVVGQFDNINLLTGMDWDMSGAFIKGDSANAVRQTDWVLKDGEKYFSVTDNIFKTMYEYCPEESITKSHIKSTIMKDVTQPQSENATARELTPGEKQIGIHFNPSQFPDVDKIKQLAAALADELFVQREKAKSENNGEKIAQYTLAIRHTEDASYRGVKAATWQF